MNDRKPEVLTNADILEGLRRVNSRQLEPQLEPAIVAELMYREFIAYGPHAACDCMKCSLCIDGACASTTLTERGHAALDWLLSVQRSPLWDQLRLKSYGS
jgi:hypothetical protein